MNKLGQGLANANVFKINSKHCSSRLAIEIDYSPIYNDSMQCTLNTVPILNNDQEPSQPGFIMKAEQPMLLQNQDSYKRQFQNKLAELGQKNKNLYVPRPKGCQIFCNVCKEHIGDYLQVFKQKNQHIESKAHKLKFKKNSSVTLINFYATELQNEQSRHQSTLLNSSQRSCGPLPEIEEFDSTTCEPHMVKKVRVQGQGNFVDSCQYELSCQANPEQITQLLLMKNNNHVVEIVEPHYGSGGVYIGDEKSAMDMSILTQFDINSILTVEIGSKVKFDGNPQIIFHKRLPVDKNDCGSLFKYFFECFMFIEKSGQMGNVLIHCINGTCLSPVFAASYLIHKAKYNVEQAWYYVSQAQPKALIKANLMNQLLKYEQSLDMEIVLGQRSRSGERLRVIEDKPKSMLEIIREREIKTNDYLQSVYAKYNY